MATSEQFLTPGKGKVWISTPGQTGNPTTWEALPHTVTWEFTADIEEASELRTSDTLGAKVQTCGGATSFEANFSSALCEADWLYSYILDGTAVDPSAGKTLWFYCSPYGAEVGAIEAPQPINTALAVQHLALGLGTYFKGTVQPPGIELDNDSSDAVVSEWSVKIQAGPYLPIPALFTATTTPRPLAYLGT